MVNSIYLYVANNRIKDASVIMKKYVNLKEINTPIPINIAVFIYFIINGISLIFFMYK